MFCFFRSFLLVLGLLLPENVYFTIFLAIVVEILVVHHHFKAKTVVFKSCFTKNVEEIRYFGKFMLNIW